MTSRLYLKCGLSRSLWNFIFLMSHIFSRDWCVSFRLSRCASFQWFVFETACYLCFCILRRRYVYCNWRNRCMSLQVFRLVKSLFRWRSKVNTSRLVFDCVFRCSKYWIFILYYFCHCHSHINTVDSRIYAACFDTNHKWSSNWVSLQISFQIPIFWYTIFDLLLWSGLIECWWSPKASTSRWMRCRGFLSRCILSEHT